MKKPTIVNPFSTKVNNRRITSGKLVSREISGSMTLGMKRLLSLRIFKIGRAISYLLSHASSRAYGCAMLGFGLFSLIFYFTGLYHGATVTTAIIGAAFSVIAIPFLLSENPLSILLQDIAVTDYIFFEFFCIKRVNRMEAMSKFPPLAAMLVGIVVAGIGILFPISNVLIVIGAIIFVYLSFISPEFAFFSTFLVLPYLGYVENATVWFGVLIMLSAVSFFRKVIYGKRVFHIEQYEIILAAFIFFILVSGIFVKGAESFTRSVEMLIMTFGYILASNIITNRRLAERVLNSIVIASIPPAVGSIVKFVTIIANGRLSELVDVGIDSSFGNTDAYAVFLIVAIVLSVAMIKHNRGFAKAFYIAAIAFDLIALILTCEAFALFALLIGLVAYGIFKSNRFAFALPVILILPLAVFFVPSRILDSVFGIIPSLPTVAEFTALWRTCLSKFLGNVFVGIGIGAESFAEEMAGGELAGFTNSSNLFLELGLEAGIFALICFILLLIFRLRHRVIYHVYVKNSEVSVLSPISAACIFCLIAYGLTNYIWSDLSAYYLFIAVFGIGSATLRVAKKEYDDRVFYYEDTRASDSSVIDIELK